MTGYQETLTDPSYAGQVVVMTAPHIGNTGVNGEDDESRRMWVAGFVVRDPARRPANWRSTGSLDDELVAPGRRRHQRHRHPGAHPAPARARRHAGRASAARSPTPTSCWPGCSAAESMTGADLAPAGEHRASPTSCPAVGEKRFTIAALDLGIKTATPRHLAELGVETHVLPATATAEELLAAGPDGVFLSNGPGDPAAADYAVEAVRGRARRRAGRCSASASATRSSAARSAWAPTSCASATAGSTSRCSTGSAARCG